MLLRGETQLREELMEMKPMQMFRRTSGRKMPPAVTRESNVDVRGEAGEPHCRWCFSNMVEVVQWRRGREARACG